jgi:AP-1-like factor
MDAYTDTSFWDNTPTFNQLPDSDFFALLQKQFPPTAPPFAEVNPQNLSSYPLPSLTSSEEESSPSPPNSNRDVSNDDVNEPPLKRKASGDEISDIPNQKTQHTGKVLSHPDYSIPHYYPQSPNQIRKVPATLPDESQLAMP